MIDQHRKCVADSAQFFSIPIACSPHSSFQVSCTVCNTPPASNLLMDGWPMSSRQRLHTLFINCEFLHCLQHIALVFTWPWTTAAFNQVPYIQQQTSALKWAQFPSLPAIRLSGYFQLRGERFLDKQKNERWIRCDACWRWEGGINKDSFKISQRPMAYRCAYAGKHGNRNMECNTVFLFN